jgi:hypothetical protein
MNLDQSNGANRTAESSLLACMNDYERIFAAVTSDERYLANLDWGQPRRGHPEGTVRAHINELERNLNRLRRRLTDEECWKQKLLIHTHDSFKTEAQAGVMISHPRSHASLARAFLAEFCRDEDLLAMVQLHDEPYALYQQQQRRAIVDAVRFEKLMASIRDWRLFSAFLLIDGCTAATAARYNGLRRSSKVEASFGVEDIGEHGNHSAMNCSSRILDRTLPN